MRNKEIQEIIIACIDYAAENEKYSKDIMKEIYQYIDKHYNNNIDEDKLDELAKEYANKNSITKLNLWNLETGYKAGYRKAMEK